jgi:hypothetical protein
MIYAFFLGAALLVSTPDPPDLPHEQVNDKHIIPYDCQPAPEWSEHAYVCHE